MKGGAPAPRRQRPVPAAQRASSPTTSTTPTRPRRARAEDRPRHRSPSSAAASPASSPAGSRRRPHHREGRRLRRHLVLEPLPRRQCDTASFVYMPLLEETGHMPTEKYAHAPEILEHCQRIGKQFGLYDNALFHTEVTDLEWDDDASRWIIRTNRGDEFTAQFLGMGTGPLHVPKLPGIPGIESLRGPLVPHEPVGLRLHRRRPRRRADGQARRQAGRHHRHRAPPRCSASPTWRACEELYVFQRTPSSVDVRDNRPTDPEWFAEIDTRAGSSVAGELHRQPDRRLGRRGPRAWTAGPTSARRIRSRIMPLPPEEFTPRG